MESIVALAESYKTNHQPTIYVDVLPRYVTWFVIFHYFVLLGAPNSETVSHSGKDMKGTIEEQDETYKTSHYSTKYLNGRPRYVTLKFTLWRNNDVK